jgi:phosphoribosylcarboxyaminoimidazole (NCAIR) mutase
LGTQRPRWRSGAAACIVMASGGYPGDYPKGLEITGLERVNTSADCQVFHAGTARHAERWVTQGGRVLGVTAWGATLGEALARGYRATEPIHWKGATLRRDIGLKGLRHVSRHRPGLNVGLLAPPAALQAEARSAVAWLERLGLGVRAAPPAAEAGALRSWLRDCEEAGAEVFVTLCPEGGHPAEQVARLTRQPVVGARLNQFPQAVPVGTATHSSPGADGVHWAAGGPAEAALLAAQILAFKYPDVWAALQQWRLEQELSGAPARAAGASTSLF